MNDEERNRGRGEGMEKNGNRKGDGKRRIKKSKRGNGIKRKDGKKAKIYTNR